MIGSGYQFGSKEAKRLFCGANKFYVQDLEVYQLN